MHGDATTMRHEKGAKGLTVCVSVELMKGASLSHFVMLVRGYIGLSQSVNLIRGHPLSTYSPRGRGDPKVYVVSEVA